MSSTTSSQLKTASELFSRSQGSCNSGDRRCHWCASPCTMQYRHDGQPRLPFIRTGPPLPQEEFKRQALHSFGIYPDSIWSCHGCWLWRRPRVTVWFLGGKEFKDGQGALNHSWWVTEEGAWAIRNPQDHKHLWGLVLQPPLRFFLSFRSGKELNHLQCCVLNDNLSIDASTELHFTSDNVRHTYTVYELEQGVRHGPEGKSGGVRVLLQLLGADECNVPLGKDPQGHHSGMGQPSVSAVRATKKIVTASGG